MIDVQAEEADMAEAIVVEADTGEATALLMAEFVYVQESQRLYHCSRTVGVTTQEADTVTEEATVAAMEEVMLHRMAEFASFRGFRELVHFSRTL